MSEPNIPSKFEVPVFPPFAAFSVPTTKILAIGSLNTSKPAEIAKVLPYEVRQTVALHLEGKIDQWWSLTSRLGVVFVMNCTTVEEAHDLLEKLPLGIAGMMTFELHPIGPLKPLMLLAGTPVPGEGNRAPASPPSTRLRCNQRGGKTSSPRALRAIRGRHAGTGVKHIGCKSLERPTRLRV